MTSTNTAPQRVLAIVGGGPRAVSLTERVLARQLAGEPVNLARIVIVDAWPVGPGKIWRTDQNPELCMNTLAGAVTLFTDEGFTGAGPVIEGPTLYEWGRLAHGDRGGISPERVAAFDQQPVRPGLTDDPVLAAELSGLRPESHPSRALFGHYLRWVLDRTQALSQVQIDELHGQVVAIEAAGDQEQLTLADGTTLLADEVVLAPGWVSVQPSPADQRLAQAAAEVPGLAWVGPESPVDQDLSVITPGEPVIVRGLGMGFFDSMALLTLGRGGEFVDRPDGGLNYLPSGREPVLHVTSRRGVPFRAKSLYGGLPPVAELDFLRSVDWARVPRPIDFTSQVWPLIVKDAHLAHATTLARLQPGAVTDLDGLRRALAQADVDQVSQVVTEFIPDPAHRFDLAALAHPASGQFASPAAFDEFVIDLLADDLHHAEQGLDSAIKAGLWSVSASRRLVSTLFSFDGTSHESHSGPFAEFMAFGGMVGSGPPAFRNRQLLALARAGLVHFIGPGARVEVTADGFSAQSRQVADSRVTARVLLDAWMRSPDVRASGDRLVNQLLDSGRLRAHRRPAAAGGLGPEGAGFDLDRHSSRLVDAAGELQPRLYAAGIPIDAVRGDVVISPMPRTDPTMLRELDAIIEAIAQAAKTAPSDSIAGPPVSSQPMPTEPIRSTR